MADEPTDKQTLINKALTVIGHTPISIEDEDDKAESASTAFDLTVDEIFGLHAWSWAKTRRALQRITTPSGSTKPHAFQYPGDVLGAPLAVFSSVQPEQRDFGYILQGSMLFADGENRWADFQEVKPLAQWPSAFRAGFIKALAAELCIPIAELIELRAVYRTELFGRDWEQYQGGLFGRLIAADKAAQPLHTPQLGHQLNSARRS